MNHPEEHSNEQVGDQESDDPLPTLTQKDSIMSDATSHKPFSLSCWWSRGPSGQVQEWESRPTPPQNPPRAHNEHRPSSVRWKRKTRTQNTTKA